MAKVVNKPPPAGKAPKGGKAGSGFSRVPSPKGGLKGSKK